MLGRSPDIRWHHSQQSFWFTSELVISWRSKKIAHVSSSNHSSEKIEGQRAKGKGQKPQTNIFPFFVCTLQFIQWNGLTPLCKRSSNTMTCAITMQIMTALTRSSTQSSQKEWRMIMHFCQIVMTLHWRWMTHAVELKMNGAPLWMHWIINLSSKKIKWHNAR